MSEYSESPVDRLWREYSVVFRDWDDMTLGRWLAQTLGQLEGRAWRLSHPLMGAYRLAAQVAHDRQIWFKRVAHTPPAYTEATCCRAPLLPLFTRDVADTGLVCQHCGETCVPFEELPENLLGDVQKWAEQYSSVHGVAHWEDAQRKRAGNYQGKFEEAARKAEQFLAQAGSRMVPQFLEFFPSVVWEDQDECLEVRPEDVEVST